MKPSRQLIDALRRAADRIVAPNSDYDWGTSAQCNCGFLALELGFPREQFRHSGAWRYKASRAACGVTGRPIYEVIRAMFGMGLTEQDIADIEGLLDQAVRRRADLPSGCSGYSNPNFVAKYFRAQADILEEQLAPKPTPPKPVLECPHLWLESGVCIYCCATKPAERKEFA